MEFMGFETGLLTFIVLKSHAQVLLIYQAVAIRCVPHVVGDSRRHATVASGRTSHSLRHQKVYVLGYFKAFQTFS
jgi:hypothetical protein